MHAALHTRVLPRGAAASLLALAAIAGAVVPAESWRDAPAILSRVAGILF